MSKLRIAIVAPTLDILGGHSVQAARLLAAWRDDPDVEAWLVPINPRPPAALTAALNVKYLRTLVTEATYLPLLVRELARADVVHIFSASYSSFLLAPLPAMTVAGLLGRPVVLNYHSGEAADHLQRSAIARAALSRVQANVVPSPFLAEVFARFGLAAIVIPNIIDLQRFAYRDRDPLRPRFLSTRNLGYPYNVACTIRAFRLIQDRRSDASLTVAGRWARVSRRSGGRRPRRRPGRRARAGGAGRGARSACMCTGVSRRPRAPIEMQITIASDTSPTRETSDLKPTHRPRRPGA